MENYLEFEKPIAELETKIVALNNIGDSVDIEGEKQSLHKKNQELTAKIFKELDDLQISQVARHPSRPYTLDYLPLVFEEFIELHGDRAYGDDTAIIGGIATLNNEGNTQKVMFIGQQKGRTTKEKIHHNFGMPRPEGYRKALRLMNLAEKFNLPIISFIDTPGAYPGIGAEERGQSEAIAKNLFAMSNLKTPIISVVIGEGGSGGALAIGVADAVLMFEYSIYSVISPEGCASILYKDSAKSDLAAKSLKLTSKHLQKFNLIDGIIDEPLGGNHRDFNAAAHNLKTNLIQHLSTLQEQSIDALLQNRATKILNFGEFN
jgi:acetyl-CoA carboxylase carboxyl transferase subunit alpha